MQVYPDTHIHIIKHKIHLWQKELLSPPNISTFRTGWSPVILRYHAFQGLMQTQVHTWQLKLSYPPLFFFHVLPWFLVSCLLTPLLSKKTALPSSETPEIQSNFPKCVEKSLPARDLELFPLPGAFFL